MANNDDNENFYNDFLIESIQKCYYCYYEEDEWKIDLSIILYWGTTNGNKSYVLYDNKNNIRIEYSMVINDVWNVSPDSYDALIFFQGHYYGRVLKASNMIYYYDDNTVLCKISEDLCTNIEPQKAQNVEINSFSLNENIIKRNDIDNDFYFKNLINNYGNNIKGSCCFVAMGMLFSYVNEFIDNRIIPNSFEFNYDGNDYNYSKDHILEKSISTDYNISNVESPGSNELFHQFLIDYFNEYINLDNEYKYSIGFASLHRTIEGYLEQYYLNSSLVDIRCVSDYRYHYSSDLEYYQNEIDSDIQSTSDVFEFSYEYYEAQRNKNILKNEDYSLEYEFDILKEIDKGNPVLIIAKEDDEVEINYEDYHGNKVLKKIELPGYHAMIAYGYVQTENGIYYRCHYGNKMPYSTFNNNDIYFKSDDIVTGYVLKRFNTETNVESSSYYYDNGECLINLPTDEIYETYDEFVKNEGNVEFNNTTEYYYCNCETKHLLYQCGHNYHYRKIDDSTHQKYCHCGYNYIENHTIEHTTSTTYDHYAYCIDCSYHDYFAEGIIYYVGEDPYNMPEHYHTWSCSLCNLSGVYNHTLEFESLGENYHQMNCKYCDYQDLAPHGCGYNVEIYYNKIADDMHLAYCIGCKEEWIETHIGCNCHL